MLKHKRTLAGILAATMMLSMAACGGGGSQKDGDVAEGPQDPNAAAAAGTLELTDWEQSSGIFNTDETDEGKGGGQGNGLLDLFPYHQGSQGLR